jgi:hypothetical protein
MAWVKLEGCDKKLAVEIPKTITELYSLKIGTMFQLRAKEVQGHLSINLITELTE